MLPKNNIDSQFFEKPTSRFQLRELARLTKLSTTAVKAALERLLEEKIIKTEKDKHYVFYKANWDASEYKWAKKFYNVKKILASGLLEHLEETLNYPEAIVLFGSAAKGEDAERSDIDIFALVTVKREPMIETYVKKISRPIRILVMDKAEFKLAKKKNPELINNILNGIILKGYLEAL